jgi:hypothetical protein
MANIEYKTVFKGNKPELSTASGPLPQSSLQGIKHDSEKPKHDLLPYESLDEIAKVLTFGEKKYEAGNWANGMQMRRLISAAYRHLGLFNSGEDIDPDSGLSHLAHAATNLVFAIWMQKNKPQFDDRWIKEIKNK